MHFTGTFVLQYCKHHHQPTQQDRNSAVIQGSDLLNNHSSTVLEVQILNTKYELLNCWGNFEIFTQNLDFSFELQKQMSQQCLFKVLSLRQKFILIHCSQDTCCMLIYSTHSKFLSKTSTDFHIPIKHILPEELLNFHGKNPA